MSIPRLLLRSTLLLTTFSLVAQAQLPAPPVVLRKAPGAGHGAERTAWNGKFHLTARFTTNDPDFATTMTLDWAGPRMWRRTLESHDYSQAIAVNGDAIEEKASDSYMPLELEVLIPALLRPLVGSTAGANAAILRPSNYTVFHGITLPKQLLFSRGEGDGYAMAIVTELSDLPNSDPDLFTVHQPTPESGQLQTAEISEQELIRILPTDHEIIWPQILDGRETGQELFLISVDTQGNVQQVLPQKNINGMANQSAMRQIKRWKFAPMTRDGVPVQFSGLMTVEVDTRKYGPKEPLTDAEVRALAEHVEEAVFSPAVAPGSVAIERVAIDSDGELAESISSGDADRECFDAIRKWKFRPLMVDGKPMPYRATIECRAK